MLKENDAPAQRSWELAIQHNPDALEEVYAANLVCHEQDRDVQGVEEVRQYPYTHLSASPDLPFAVEDVIVDEDKVVSRWTVGSINGRAVKVLAALALCGLAVSLVLLFAPDISWAAVLEWLTTSSPCPSEYLR